MAARFDKYNPMGGGFRAPLNAAIITNQIGTLIAVSINGSGRVVVGGGSADVLVGLIVPTQTMAVGDQVDVMRTGEVVGDALTLGSIVYGHIDGTVDNVATAGKYFGIKVATAGATAPRIVVSVRPGAA